MNLGDLAATFLRRWYLVVLGVVLTIAACAGVYTVVPPSYEATASVVLLPPKGGATAVVNPYLALNGLAPVVDVLSGSLNTKTIGDEVKATAPGTTYKIGQDPTSSAPMLQLTVTSSDSAASIRALNFLLSQVPPKLVDLQRAVQVKSNASITALFVAVDKRPTVVQKARIRLVAAAGAFVLAGSIVAIALLDGLLLARRGGGRSAGGPRGTARGRGRNRRPLDDDPASDPTSEPQPAVDGRRDDAQRPSKVAGTPRAGATNGTKATKPRKRPAGVANQRSAPSRGSGAVAGKTTQKTRPVRQPSPSPRSSRVDPAAPGGTAELPRRPWVKTRESE